MRLQQHQMLTAIVLVASRITNLGSSAFLVSPKITPCQRSVSGLGVHAESEPASSNTEPVHVTTMNEMSPTWASSSRRSFFQKVLWSGLLSALPLLAGSNDQALAAEVELQAGAVSAEELATKLRGVPTFTIVDRKGVPYTVVGEDAKITGYFFTTYDEAERILKVARTSADKGIKEAEKELISKRKAEQLPPLSKQEVESEVGSNPWIDARISTIPLDIATTLSLNRPKAASGSYFQVAAAAGDIEDALQVLDKADLPEGRVPLFYMADFTIIGDDDAQKRSPLYFRKKELLDDFRRLNPKERDLPPVLVTDLFATMTAMVKPGSGDEMKAVSFETPKGSAKKAKECEKRGGSEPPLLLGQRIVVL